MKSKVKSALALLRRRADGGEVDDTSVRREDIPPRPWLPHIEFRPQIEDRSAQDRPVLKGPLDKIVAHAVDLAKTPGDVMAGKYRAEPEVPGQISETDIARQNMLDRRLTRRAGEMALTMVGMPGLTGGVPANALGSAARNPDLFHGVSKVKLPKPVSEMTSIIEPTAQGAEKVIAPSKLQGSVLYPLIGDRSRSGGNLTRVNGYPFETPVPMQGGHSYMRDADMAWASDKVQSSKVANAVKLATQKFEKPVHGVYSAMGERSIDFSHHISDALLQMQKHTKVSRESKGLFDAEMSARYPDWPGLNSSDLPQFIREAPGGVRSDFAKLMDTAEFQKRGFPSVAEARVAATDPRLLNEQTGASGLSIARMDPKGTMGASDHLSYNTGVGGQYVGGLPTSVPREVMFPDLVGKLEQHIQSAPGYKPRMDYLMQRMPKEIQPFQVADQKWVDTVSKNLEDRGFTLGSGSRDKRAGAATLAADARLAEAEAPGYLKAERTADAGPGPAAARPDATATPAPAVGPGGGGASGARSVDEAQAAAARWAGARPTLEGQQGALKIGQDYFVPGPIGKIHDVAEDYMRTVHPDLKYSPPTKYHPIDPDHSKAVAQAYEEMKHAPNDPAVKQSYDALIDETTKQYQAIKKTGLKIEPIPANMPDPYAANPRLAALDVAENNHLWFFPTEGGFGTVNKITDNPMLRKTGEKIGDHELLANDMFRVVHDYFGHLKEGHGFRAAGEDNAWRTHSAMYSDIARPAMTSETRGQNSWVNYGPQGEKNRTANAVDTTYADQKVGIMPEWTMRDAGSQAPIVAHHGTPHKFDRFDLKKVGTGEGEEVYGHGLYFAESPKVAKHYRDILTKPEHQPLLLNGRPVNQMWNDGIKETWADEIKKLPRGQRDDFVDIMSNLSQIQRPDQAHHVTSNFTPQQMKLYKEKIEPHLAASPKNKGSMYQVALDVDPKQLLDWDRIFKEQSPHVRKSLMDDLVKLQAERQQAQAKLLERGPKETSFTGRPLSPLHKAQEELKHRQMRERAGKSPEQLADELSGPNAYKQMGLPAVTQEQGYRQSSTALKERGVPGLKYLDQGSRDKTRGKRTSNYVMFDDALVRILKRYGIMLPGGGVAAQFKREQEPEARASGGAVNDALRLIGRMKRKKGVHIGPIISSVAGRTDHHPMSVPAGSYVLPADHVSSLGEGNTLSGMEVVNKMFSMGPYETKSTRTKHASGGPVEKPIEIVAAGGEVVIPPEKIAERFGDLDSGHSALDAWVIENRKNHIKTLSELPGPAQD